MNVPQPSVILTDICRRLDWRALFGNDHPVELDLGAGDGGFALAYAQQHPGINLFAVERLLGRVAVLQQVSEPRPRRVVVGACARACGAVASRAATNAAVDATITATTIVSANPATS